MMFILPLFSLVIIAFLLKEKLLFEGFFIISVLLTRSFVNNLSKSGIPRRCLSNTGSESKIKVDDIQHFIGKMKKGGRRSVCHSGKQ